MTDIAILAAALLGLLFPWQLVAAHPHPRPRPGRALLHPGLYPLWGPGAALPDGGALLTRSMEQHYKKNKIRNCPIWEGSGSFVF